MIPEPIAAFLRSSVKTTWALDLLLLLKGAPRAVNAREPNDGGLRPPARLWSIGDLTSELRSSPPIVKEALETFIRLGLVGEVGGGCYQYLATAAELDAIVSELARLYAQRPLAIIREIVSAPNDKIQSFVDAFRLKKD